MNLFNIERAFKNMKERKWTKLYWAIDLHDTVITGKYNKFNVGAEVYPGVLEMFDWFAKRHADMVPILYTSSHPEAIKRLMRDELWPRGIEFTYINENPECPSNDMCNFEGKFYFNILLDDKAGFDGNFDWHNIRDELVRLGEW